MEMDPEDIPRAGLEEMRRAGTCSGGGSGRHYQGWPPRDLEVARETDPEGIPEAGLEMIQEFRKASGAARLASKRFASLERGMELDLAGNLEAGFEDLRKVEAGSEVGSGRHS